MSSCAPNVHRLTYLIASSVTRITEIRKARINGEEVELPLSLEEVEPGTRIEFTLPSIMEARDNELLFLVMDCDLECIVVANGEEVHGYDWAHRWVPLPKEIKSLGLVVGGGRVDLFGIAIERRSKALLRSAKIIGVDWRTYRLGIALAYLCRVCAEIPDEELRKDIASLVDSALRKVAPRALDPQRMVIAHEVLSKVNPLQGVVSVCAIDALTEYLDIARESGFVDVDTDRIGALSDEAYADLLRALEALSLKYGKRGRVIPLAQSHLDYLWLWSKKSFYIKLGKTFATCLSIANSSPWLKVVFTSSHYLEELKEKFPKLFEKLVKCFKDGKCLIAGGIWTEFDANTIDSEALARQFLYGQRTLRELLGSESRVLYLPDTFGFPPTLPEVAKVGGIELFIDRKLSWNDTNRFPYMYFRWIAPSGTSLLAIYAGHCYTHELNPKKLLLAWNENSEKDVVNAIPLLFGYGDGGGGPTIEQLVELEVIDRCPLLPKVDKLGPERLLDELKTVKNKLPTWFGELYLENHRGVYSTGINLKKALKEVVVELKKIDALRASIKVLGINEDREVKKVLDRAWKLALQSYFHDTASATLSREAYVDAMNEIEEARKLANVALNRLISTVSELARKGIVIFNPLPWRRKALVLLEVEGDSLCVDNSPVPTQKVGKKILAEVELPALGFVTLHPCSSKHGDLNGVEVEARGSEIELRVDGLRYEIYEGGVVRVELEGYGRVIDMGNSLKAYVDFPREWDAWNVDADYELEELKVEGSKPRLLEVGPLRACVEVENRFGSSRIRQIICLDRSGLLRIKYAASLKDRHTILKSLFRHTLTISNVIVEAPFGIFERPAYVSTSWERAKYEAWMGRWVAVSQNDVGFAIVAPFGSRGVSVGPNHVSYTIARTPVYPHPFIDHEGFETDLYLYVFRGPWFEASIHRVAMELEIEPIVIEGRGAKEEMPMGIDVLKVEPINVAIECVKPCEEGDCIVLHGFEACRKKASLRISSGVKSFGKVWRCNWQETEKHEVQSLDLRPLQVFCLAIDIR